MTNLILNSFRHFRQKLFNIFTYRSDSTLDLIDAIAGQTTKESSVKLSLCRLFRRGYSSITDVVDNLFRQKAEVNPNPEELKKEQTKLTALFAEQCPPLLHRKFELFAVDCSSNPRVYSQKLEDRGYVHSPTKVPGQKPITVGHQYSTVVYLPEKMTSSEPHWVIPLSLIRVKSEESATCRGMQQILEIVTSDQFKNKLCVSTNDSAYSNAICLKAANRQPNLVNIARIRNNQKFYLPLLASEEPKKPGRPKIYGPRWT
ncbi:MAG TPA: transposase, partial [Parachlamydiaceae bacterium]|nr:transposase [Parachlamydiaceae bacterium]